MFEVSSFRFQVFWVFFLNSFLLINTIHLSMKKNFKNLILILILIVISGCSTTQAGRLKSEKDFQYAFNDAYFHGRGRMEVSVKYGRVDILTRDFAVEVDRLSKFHEGIGQALHYARETGKRPGLAIFIVNPDREDLKKLKHVCKLCELYGIRAWYINDELKKAKKK